MSVDHNYDDRLYCASCLHLLGEDDLRYEPGEVIGCAYCPCGVLSSINHRQMLGVKARRRSEWEAAKGDGLIL